MNGSEKKRFSVIIPTREGAATLGFTIASALEQTCETYEVIVSDNCSQDNTKEIVRSFSDHRLMYINTGRRLSMCDNWEFALSRASGEYIIFIGDDDAVVPGALDQLEDFVTGNFGLVYCWSKPTYVWPIDGNRPLVRARPSPRPPVDLELRKLARIVVKMGGARYSFLPSVYHSAIPKRILDLMREQTGRVFHSTQPDIFTAMALPVFSEKAVDVGYAVTVGGQSQHSNSVSSYKSNGIEVIERFVREYGDYKIHNSLFPDVHPVINLLPDTILVAMDTYQEFYSSVQFNYSAMWAYLIRMAKSFHWPLDLWDILEKKQRIKLCHPFDFKIFISYYMLNELASIYRRVGERTSYSGPRGKDIPDNISDFAGQFAKWQSAGMSCM